MDDCLEGVMMVLRREVTLSSWFRLVLSAVLLAILALSAGGCDIDPKRNSNSALKPEINDLSIIDAADGECDGLPDGSERDINCRFTIASNKGGGEKPTKAMSKACSVRPDPTTGKGCITPRTKQLVDRVKKTGYAKRDITCFANRDHTSEHPKGRACDFMMTGGGKATGNDKQRGDKLAAWAVAHHGELGVIYVIWYNRIWTDDGRGWHKYGNPYGEDDPSGHHTNHVHASVRSG